MEFLRPIRVHSGDAAPRRLFATNLSEGGMFIRTPRPLPVGSVVELALPEKAGDVPFARATVTYAVPVGAPGGADALPGFGVRFLELTAPAKALMETLIAAGPVSSNDLTGVEATAPNPLGQTVLNARTLFRERTRSFAWAVAVASLLALAFGVWTVRNARVLPLPSAPAVDTRKAHAELPTQKPRARAGHGSAKTASPISVRRTARPGPLRSARACSG